MALMNADEELKLEERGFKAVLFGGSAEKETPSGLQVIGFHSALLAGSGSMKRKGELAAPCLFGRVF